MKSFTTNLLKNHLKDSITTQEFTQQNYEHLYERLKYVSYMLIFTYPCFFIVDFFLLKNLNSPTFKVVLAAVHLTGLLISLFFIMIYRSNVKLVSKRFVVESYVLLYLLIGVISSINSQLFTKNIYAYIIILLGIAAIFPIRPRNLFIKYVTVQVFFLIGLSLIEPNHYSYLSMLINSTGTAAISFTISLAFYSFRKSEFLIKRKLRRSEESFRSLFNLNPKALILMRLEDHEMVLMNNQAVEYYHLKPSSTKHFDISFLFSSAQEKQEMLKRLYEEKSIKNYVTQQQITGELKKWSLLNFEMIDYLGQTCILIDTTDITDIKKKEAELFMHASIDMLTGVRNRRSGMELLSKLLADGPHSQEFIICYIDVNNLKIVNDRYGHAAGDDLIKTCCETINCHLDHNDVLFRLGGDEFVIIFFKQQLKAVQMVWDAIQMAFQDINESAQRPYQISASHGFYHYKPGTPPLTIEEILERADMEMYKKKVVFKTLQQTEYS